MGKAVSNSIKAKARIIIKEFEDKLGIEFEKNKLFLKSMKLPLSKLTVNLMAGYITRTLKIKIKEKEALAKKMNPNRVPVKTVKDQQIHG